MKPRSARRLIPGVALLLVFGVVGSAAALTYNTYGATTTRSTSTPDVTVEVSAKLPAQVIRDSSRHQTVPIQLTWTSNARTLEFAHSGWMTLGVMAADTDGSNGFRTPSFWATDAYVSSGRQATVELNVPKGRSTSPDGTYPVYLDHANVIAHFDSGGYDEFTFRNVYLGSLKILEKTSTRLTSINARSGNRIEMVGKVSASDETGAINVTGVPVRVYFDPYGSPSKRLVTTVYTDGTSTFTTTPARRGAGRWSFVLQADRRWATSSTSKAVTK